MCNKCQKQLPAESFNKNSGNKDGLQYTCRDCLKKLYQKNKTVHQQRNREYYQQNWTRCQARKKKWAEENQEKISIYKRKYYLKKRQSTDGAFSIYKKDAQRRRLQFLLSKEEFISFKNQSCFYCGTPMRQIGIDRCNPDIGYRLDNCVSCCKMCNYIKRSMQLDEFKRHIQRIYNYLIKEDKNACRD